MKPPKDRELKLVLDDIPEEEEMVTSMTVFQEEKAFVDALMTHDQEPKHGAFGSAASLAEAIWKELRKETTIHPLMPQMHHTWCQ